MRSSEKKEKRTYLAVLAITVILAFVIFGLTKGKLDFSLAARTLTAPTDTENNLAYGLLYHPSSSCVLERNSILLKNFGNKLCAYDEDSGISLDAAAITERSDKPIIQFSEYAATFYLYDGQTVYRTNVDGSKLKAAIKDCLKFEPMGTYLYSLKMYHGEKWLYRCSIIGTYEKRLFKEPVEDFWAYGGHLLMLTKKGEYRYYSVLTQNSFIHHLPEGAASISLDGEGILYLYNDNPQEAPLLHRRSFLSDEDTILSKEPVLAYSAGEGNIALLLDSPGADDKAFCAAYLEAEVGKTLTRFSQKTFSAGCSLDISAEHLFVTEKDGTTVYTSLQQEDWQPLFGEQP